MVRLYHLVVASVSMVEKATSEEVEVGGRKGQEHQILVHLQPLNMIFLKHVIGNLRKFQIVKNFPQNLKFIARWKVKGGDTQLHDFQHTDIEN